MLSIAAGWAVSSLKDNPYSELARPPAASLPEGPGGRSDTGKTISLFEIC